MPVLIGNTVHALPAPGATVTRCGVPFDMPPTMGVQGYPAEGPVLRGVPTKARVTCLECKRVGSAEFVAGWGRAIAEGRIDTDEPNSSE